MVPTSAITALLSQTNMGEPAPISNAPDRDLIYTDTRSQRVAV